MSLPPHVTVEDYIALVKTFMPDFHRVVCARTEDEFLDAAAAAVRHCLQMLEDRRALLQKATEKQLATDLADLLTRGGLPTTSESHVNGHVDLTISHFVAGGYRMLGECKIDRGPKHHCNGTTQLLGYCCGAEKQALCIGFCRERDIKGRVASIRQHFDSGDACHSVSETRDHDLPWSFMGAHRHTSGATVEVLHIACNLHDPDLPSGVKAS